MQASQNAFAKSLARDLVDSPDEVNPELQS
jgi:hypothetical protein